MILILLGAPGAGKGTQAERISEGYNLRHLSTGDLLRGAVAEGSELGRMAKGYMDAGELVPDDVILGIIRDYLHDHAGEGILFDGFPRTLTQAEGLDRLIEGYELKALALEVPDEVVVERLSSRRVCRECGKIFNPAAGIMPDGDRCTECGGEVYQRDDDRPETIRQRLEVYHNQTEPIIDYYKRRGLLVEIEGRGDPDEIFNRVRKALD